MFHRTVLSLEQLEDRTVPAIIYSINAGGPALAGTPNWEADSDANPSTFSNLLSAQSQTFSTPEAIDLSHASIPAGTPEEVFESERWDPLGGDEMQWDFAVTPGVYNVHLYFADIYGGTHQVGARVFDVAIEGQTVLQDYDIFALVGGYAGIVESFQVTSDNNLDIDFAHLVENPAIKGIQIEQVAGQPSQLGISSNNVDFNDILVGTTSTQTMTLSNLGQTGDPSIVVDTTTITGADAGLFSDDFDDANNVTLAPGESTTFDVTYAPTVAGPHSATLTIDHSGDNDPLVVDLDGTAVSDIPVGFGKSTLTGTDLGNPTSLQFGPDGRLYVAEQSGLINIYTVERSGPNEYAVTATETLTSVQEIVNHDDDGSVNPSIDTRLVTGLLVTGTAANPVLYVTSSDPRIGAGPLGEDLNLDTNSGILSRLTFNGSTWDKVDLVRGLPRSEENHGPNGMTLDPTTNTLYIAQGGNTNAGAPSNNFAFLPEFALSAAILSVDLDAIGDSTYDLPTLDDEDRATNNDANDPFGGNDGKNQAIIVAGGPVQVFAPGFRNPYDIVITSGGLMYSIDNGGNAGWGDVPLDSNGNPTTPATAGDATNAVHEPGITYQDNLHLITGAGYYGGHANPTRANQANTFNDSNPQSPVPFANPIEGDHQSPVLESAALSLFGSSTNGLTEYTASNFGRALQGDLLTATFSNEIVRIELNATGDAVVTQEALFNSVGVIPLDVIAVGDGDPFRGTIWVADHQASAIFVFEPNDFDSGGGVCTGADDPTLDEDGDGYNNHDEIVNGTSPCSAADVPADADGDFLSDLLDPDDDNDSILDVDDPFALDPLNGRGTPLSVLYTWENDAPNPGGLLNLGFTGLMTNGVDNYLNQFDPGQMTAGGAAGVVTVDAVSDGTALGATNTQEYALQFGVDVTPSSGPFTVQTRVLAPFAGLTPEPGQELGLFLGSGDQDNYFKVVVTGEGGVEWFREIDGVVTTGTLDTLTLPGPNAIDLYLSLDPNAATVQARYSVTSGGSTGPILDLGTPVSIPTSWWTGDMGLAVGILSTSAGPASTFPGTWDFLQVSPDTTSNVLVSADQLDFGSASVGSTKVQTLTLTNLGAAGDPTLVIDSTTLAGSGSAAFSDSFDDLNDVTLAPGESTTIDVTFTPSGTGSLSASLVINHSGENTPLVVPLLGVSEQASTGNAFLEVTPNQDINASTFTSDSFQITNNSTGGVQIQSVRYDLSTSLLQDVVFDPDGTAGDFVAKPFTPDSSTPVGLQDHVFESPRDGGFDVLEINFDDFNPGEVFTFSVDIDPTSIKGGSAPGPNESGSVSGLEMTGATVTVTFDDGSVQNINLFRTPNSPSGSQNSAKTGAPAKPGISLLGATTPVTLADPNQTIRVGGPAGATISLLHVEAGLYTDGVPGGGFDLDPFEANSVIAIDEISAVVGARGFVDIPVTLTRTDPEAGLNYFVVTIEDPDGRTGPTSDRLIVLFDPDFQGDLQNQAPIVDAGVDQSIVFPNSANLQGSAIDDTVPTANLGITWVQVSGPGTVTFSDTSALATTADFSAVGTYVLRLSVTDGELTTTDDVTIVTGSGQNQAPVVNAGADQGIALGNSANLQGTATDDGLPSGSTLVTTWSQVSGPSTVTFGDPNALSTTANFSVVGTYVLRLSATDGALTTTDDVTITVSAQNQAPVVNAGADQSIELPGSASLQGTASDDGLPAGSTLITTWSQVSGPGTVTFGDAGVLSTTANFSVAGTYVLRLTATDGSLTSTDDVIITVDPEPQQAEVLSFTLINADTDQPILTFDPLTDGAVLDLASFPTPNLNIRANLNSIPVGSVVFLLDGEEFRTENVFPYALAGDANGKYFDWAPSLGTHTLTAIPYSKRAGNGTAGISFTISFEVVDSSTSSNSASLASVSGEQTVSTSQTLETQTTSLQDEAPSSIEPGPLEAEVIDASSQDGPTEKRTKRGFWGWLKSVFASRSDRGEVFDLDWMMSLDPNRRK